MDLKQLVAQHLRDAADKLEANTCGMSTAEIIKLAHNIMHEELNKTEAAEFLNISTRTFDRKVLSGELPKGQHKAGQNSLIWYKDELITNPEH